MVARLSSALKSGVYFPLEHGNIVLCHNHQGIVGVADDTSPGRTSSFMMSSKATFQSKGPRTDPCGTLFAISLLIISDAVVQATPGPGSNPR